MLFVHVVLFLAVVCRHYGQASVYNRYPDLCAFSGRLLPAYLPCLLAFLIGYRRSSLKSSFPGTLIDCILRRGCHVNVRV